MSSLHTGSSGHFSASGLLDANSIDASGNEHESHPGGGVGRSADVEQPPKPILDTGAQQAAPESAGGHNDSGAPQSKLFNDRFEPVKAIKLGHAGQVLRALDRRKLKFEGIDPFTTLIFIPPALETSTRLSQLLGIVRRWQGLKHPDLVQMQELYRDKPSSFLTAEHLAGRSLAHHYADPNADALPADAALRIVNTVGGALNYAHTYGLVHGALSPATVWLGRQPRKAKLLDPGTTEIIAAGEIVSEPMMSGESLPASAYASPEALASHAPDLSRRADVYSLACIAYELLTGQHPFDGLNAADARNTALSVRVLAPLTRHQWQAFQRALAFQPSQRTATVQEFLSQLNRPSLFAFPAWSSVAAAGAVTAAVLIAGQVTTANRGQVTTADETAITLSSAVPDVPSDDSYKSESALSPEDESWVSPAVMSPDLAFSGLEEQEAEEVIPDEGTAVVNASDVTPGAMVAGISTGNVVEATATSEVTPAPVNQRVTELLKKANAQLSASRYIDPKGDSAMDTYREILRIAPDNTDAPQGIQVIKARLRREAQIAMQSRQYGAARSYLEMEQSIDPASEGLDYELNQLAAVQNAPASPVFQDSDDLPLETTDDGGDAQALPVENVEQVTEEQL